MSQLQQKMQYSDLCISSPYIVEIDIILLHWLKSRVPVYKSTNKNKQGLTSDSLPFAGCSRQLTRHYSFGVGAVVVTRTIRVQGLALHHVPSLSSTSCADESTEPTTFQLAASLALHVKWAELEIAALQTGGPSAIWRCSSAMVVERLILQTHLILPCLLLRLAMAPQSQSRQCSGFENQRCSRRPTASDGMYASC